MQDDVLRKLTGVDDIGASGRLLERSTPANRATARQYISDQLSSLGYTPKLDAYGSGTNVYAELPATVSTGETLVIGAHFDTVPNSPGANDNATGVAMVLAAARWARDVDCRGRNLVFVLFDQEEVGLIGSWYFAQLLSNAGTDVESVHTIDQMGWDQDGDRAIELERADTGLYQRYEDARSAAGFTMPIHSTNTGATDHVSFRDWDFAAVGITEEYVNGDTTPHYHLSSDSYDTVAQAYMNSSTRLLLATLGRQIEVVSASAPSPGPIAVIDVASASWIPRQVAPARAHGCRAH